MNITDRILGEIKRKRSFLCIGLDTDLTKIPPHLLDFENPVVEFNRQIIEATQDLCISYKINTAFYEAQGTKGWESLEATLSLIPKEIFSIADAKRGDIGNTGNQYAKAFFEALPFDSVTVAPYMGRDSIEPFLQYDGKAAIVLALTSNKGSTDLQMLDLAEGQKLYERNVELLTQWGSPDQLMMVVGATHPEHLNGIRQAAPNHFFLVPGVGAQGGSLKEVCKAGINDQVGLLVNVSRGIIYAGKDERFAEKARQSAQAYQTEMEQILKEREIV